VTAATVSLPFAAVSPPFRRGESALSPRWVRPLTAVRTSFRRRGTDNAPSSGAARAPATCAGVHAPSHPPPACTGSAARGRAHLSVHHPGHARRRRWRRHHATPPAAAASPGATRRPRRRPARP